MEFILLKKIGTSNSSLILLVSFFSHRSCHWNATNIIKQGYTLQPFF